MFVFSAPGDSPSPPPKNTYGTTSNIHRDVSEVRRDLTTTQVMVSNIHNMLKSQEGTSGQSQSVSDSNSPSPNTR